MEGHLHVSLISSRLDKSMVAMGNSCFWLAEIYKIFSSETRRNNEWLLCMNDGTICLKFPYFVPIIQFKRLVLVYDWQIKKIFSKTISPNYLKFVGSTYGSIFASQWLRSALLIFTLGIVRRIFEVTRSRFICNAASGSCNQSERALQKAHVL